MIEHPKIILKLDDVGAESQVATAPWMETMDFLADQQLVSSLGLIGRGLEMPGDGFLTWLETQSTSGHEIWNHGYAHDRPKVACPSNGAQGAEFCGMPLEHQLSALHRTQALAKERLGLALKTFGAPYNATDQVTVSAMAAVDELEIWLFKDTSFATSKHVLDRIPEVNIEYPVHVPDYDQFRQGFDRHLDKPFLVLQGHPESWFDDRSRFRGFKRIVRFLIEQKAEFLTPYDWVARCQGGGSEG